MLSLIQLLSISFLFLPQRHSLNLIFNTNSMEMRQNSNEVKEQKKRKEKETRICVQVDNKSKFAVCLKIGLFL